MIFKKIIDIDSYIIHDYWILNERIVKNHTLLSH